MSEQSSDQRVAAAGAGREISPRDAIAIDRGSADAPVFLDVREPNEWNLFRIPGAVHIPAGKLTAQVLEAAGVGPQRAVIVYCGRGNRSMNATNSLTASGRGNVKSLSGGIMAWIDAGGELEE